MSLRSSLCFFSISHCCISYLSLNKKQCSCFCSVFATLILAWANFVSFHSSWTNQGVLWTVSRSVVSEVQWFSVCNPQTSHHSYRFWCSWITFCSWLRWKKRRRKNSRAALLAFRFCVSESTWVDFASRSCCNLKWGACLLSPISPMLAFSFCCISIKGCNFSSPLSPNTVLPTFPAAFGFDPHLGPGQCVVKLSPGKSPLWSGRVEPP